MRNPAPDLIRGGRRFVDLDERSDAVLRTVMDMRQIDQLSRRQNHAQVTKQ
jgi:hypothetical protein